MNRPGIFRRWAGFFLSFAPSACGDYTLSVDRHGGPLPPDPAVCEPHAASGEGGETSTPVRYCQAALVLDAVCRRCHQEPPLFGAPFSLATYEDTQKPFDEATGKLRFQRMEEVVTSNFMPLRGSKIDPPIVPLTCEQKKTLLDWLAQCANPEGGTDCENAEAELLTCE